MCFFFFFNDTATTEIYTLSLHDALPIWHGADRARPADGQVARDDVVHQRSAAAVLHVRHVHPGAARQLLSGDRKSTRLNSSHANISYAVFCLKKKKNKKQHTTIIHNHLT